MMLGDEGPNKNIGQRFVGEDTIILRVPFRANKMVRRENPKDSQLEARLMEPGHVQRAWCISWTTDVKHGAAGDEEKAAEKING